jgi:hypothetical protein
MIDTYVVEERGLFSSVDPPDETHSTEEERREKKEERKQREETAAFAVVKLKKFLYT